MSAPLDLAVIRAAQARIRGKIHRTPVLTSAWLDEQCGGALCFKCENFQKVGAFKARGAANAVFSLTDAEAARGVATHSSGNHAAALARAAKLRGIPAYLVMPSNSAKSKIRNVEGYGGKIVFCEPTMPAREETCARLMAETRATLIHPFNDPAVVAGQGTVALEILEDRPVPDVIFVPVGGGGLISGIAVATKARRPDARVIAVEPELSPALHEALKAGRSVPVTPKSAADALSAPFAGETCVEICLKLGVESVLVSEEEIGEAFRWLYARTKLACELGAAASTAAILSGKVQVGRGQTVISVVSGGNVAPKQAAAILAS